MKAMKCDRCGKYYDYYKKVDIINDDIRFNTFALAYGNDNGAILMSKYFDLCPTCMIKVIAFVKGDETLDEH